MTVHNEGTTLLLIIVLPECRLKSQPNLVLQHIAVVRRNVLNSDCCNAKHTDLSLLPHPLLGQAALLLQACAHQLLDRSGPAGKLSESSVTGGWGAACFSSPSR